MFLLLWIACEVVALLGIRHYRAGFKWLIVAEDAAPVIPAELARKHVAGNFDPDLGWAPRPNSSGADETADGRAAFHIDNLGRRQNPGFATRDPRIAVFGDSFAFCRLVSDDETWPHLLSKELNVPVHNYGAGNYGLDQALLRLERETSVKGSQAIVMAVVPETIARIQSYWKHYLEYGNILAFKPRFKLVNETLVLVPTAVRSVKDYETYRSRIGVVRVEDGFYKEKFRKDVLRFPFMWHLIRRASRHLPILTSLVWGSISGEHHAAWRRAFEVVLRENSQLTARTLQGSGVHQALDGALRALSQNL